MDALLPDLNDTDWRVRRNAAQALGALRDKRAVESLALALKARTMTVRQRAMAALGRIGMKYEGAFDLILKMMGSPDVSQSWTLK